MSCENNRQLEGDWTLIMNGKPITITLKTPRDENSTSQVAVVNTDSEQGDNVFRSWIDSIHTNMHNVVAKLAEPINKSKLPCDTLSQGELTKRLLLVGFKHLLGCALAFNASQVYPVYYFSTGADVTNCFPEDKVTTYTKADVAEKDTDHDDAESNDNHDDNDRDQLLSDRRRSSYMYRPDGMKSSIVV